MVKAPPFDGGIVGSNPTYPAKCTLSSVGRATDSQSVGPGFEPPKVNHSAIDVIADIIRQGLAGLVLIIMDGKLRCESITSMVAIFFPLALPHYIKT